MEIPKKLKLKEYMYIIGKDCPRKNIWRREIFPEYKENRIYEDTCAVSKFFEIGYNILEEKKFSILYHPRLEADDCIAIATKHIIETSSCSSCCHFIPCNQRRRITTKQKL